MKKERRLAWRVLRHWTEIAQGGRLLRRDEIEGWMVGEDAANCVLIGVESPIELSYFVSVGLNLATAALLCRHVGRSAFVANTTGGFGAPRIGG